jgi:CHASE3 domain sensor protein
MTGTSIDSTQFRRILSRNVAMPLGMGVLSALVFVGIIAYLINVLSWVEHSEHVIGRANEVSKLSIDMEAGMRGYLLSGDDDFLAPYLVAKPKLEAELNNLARLVVDNPTQTDRVRAHPRRPEAVAGIRRGGDRAAARTQDVSTWSRAAAARP